MNWYAQDTHDIWKVLGSGEFGLDASDAKKRLETYGMNALPEAKVDSLLIIFLRQFASPLVYILLFACAAVFFLREYTDGFVILFVLLFNAVVGAFQEGKSQNALRALKRLSETKASVLRDGAEIAIPDTEVVPGDVIILREGSRVPADARVMRSADMTVDEAVLTGESVPVHKTEETLQDGVLLPGDQRNMVFKGTYVTLGNGRAVVTATGVTTLIGDIASKLGASVGEIPLKKNIRLLSHLIIAGVAVLTVVLFVLGMVSGISAKEMFLVSISVAVSIIPEGLPIVVTLILAQGVTRMAKRNVLVKKLHAVEALGQASILAVDKTGTITKNEMMVEAVYVGGGSFAVGGSGYEPSGAIAQAGETLDPLNHPELMLLGKLSTFCASAEVLFDKEKKSYQVVGDPTEAALRVFGEKIGFAKDVLEKESPELSEIPFSYVNKYHGTVHKQAGAHILAIVGAPEKVMELSVYEWTEKGIVALSDAARARFTNAAEAMSARGLRVLYAAYRESAELIRASDAPENLVLLGIIGIKDGLRPQVYHAVERARTAGIRVVMITGDHRLTAEAIAREAGIFRDGDSILTGADIDSMPESELIEKLATVSVFARVTPTHKLDIINLYRKRGETVAMTGDGVNDAPSLVAADLGVAMGVTGTEVAKEASDIVLLNDDFSNVIEAAEEGRNIYKNIKKVILYLFSTNIGELLVILVALAIGLPLPLVAVQIIWMNLVTDGFLTVAMAAEPKEKGLLSGRFKKSAKYIVDGPMVTRIITMALPMMVGTIILFKGSYEADIVKGWTVSLTVMSVFQWFNAWNCRSDRASVFTQNPFKNMPLVWATLGVVGLHMLAIYNPFFQKILRTTALSWAEWKVILLVSLSIILVEEIRKLFVRSGFLSKGEGGAVAKPVPEVSVVQ